MRQTGVGKKLQSHLEEQIKPQNLKSGVFKLH